MTPNKDKNVSESANGKRVGILSYCGGINYGCAVTNYALKEVLEKYGYAVENIHLGGPRNLRSSYYNFYRKYFNRSEPVLTYLHAEMLSDSYDIVITGSDQVWNELLLSPEIGTLAWAHGNKLLFSYAASFGENFHSFNLTDKMLYTMLSRLDAISVREASGVAICRSLGLDATHALDPVFLLEQEDYDKIIEESGDDLELPDDYVLLYANSLPKRDVLRLQNKFNEAGKTLLIYRPFDPYGATPAQWLNAIKNAQRVITNAYHGICLSIIYKKNFTYIPQTIGRERHDSLFATLGLTPDISSLSSIEPSMCYSDNAINYDGLDRRLGHLRMKSFEYLENSLSIDPNFKKEYVSHLLESNNLIEYDCNGLMVPDQAALDKLAYSSSFNPSLDTPSRDLLRTIKDIHLDRIFYAYETDDPEIMAERNLARSLLLSEAKRILDTNDLKEVETNWQFETDPHSFNMFLNNHTRDIHLQIFKAKLNKIISKDVYIIIGAGGGNLIFDKHRELLDKINIKAILFEHCSPSHSSYGAPAFDMLPYLLTAPKLPIIYFGSMPVMAKRRILSAGLDYEFIACAYE